MAVNKNIEGASSEKEEVKKEPVQSVSEIIPAITSSKENIIPATDMEAHHHTHTERKRWQHYFFEFFMLFLAVFAGFLAENWREHYIEHTRAKVFAGSLYNDLKMDTAQLN